MAGNVRQLVISLVGESKELSKTLDSATKESASFADKLKKNATKIGAGFTAAGAALTALSGPLEDSRLRLEGVGRQAGFTDTELSRLTNTNGELKQAMRASGNSASEVNEALVRLIPVTSSAEEATRALTVADELAARKGISLQQAAEMVNRALAGGTKVMKEFGIEVQEGETRLDAMARVLDGSVSTALQNTARGRMQAFIITVKDLTAQVGEKLGPALTALGPVLIALPQLINAVKVAMNGLAVAFNATAAAMRAHPLIAFAAIATAAAVAADRLWQRFGFLESGILSITQTWKNLTRQVKDFIDMVKSIPSKIPGAGVLGDVIGGVGDIASGVGGLLPFHTGGVVPGPAGQNVRAILQAGEQVIPRGSTRQGTGGVTINVAGSVITERDLGRIVADALRDNRLIGVT